jgi:predicted Zn-dependent protease
MSTARISLGSEGGLHAAAGEGRKPLMNLARICRILGVALVACAAVALAAPAAKPTPAQIEQWIKQLGDSEFVARESATRKLWEAGDHAEAALQRATKSDDPEIARRAREILDKFKWGQYPDTPKEVADLITAYQETPADKGPPFKYKAEVIRKLLRAGPFGIKAIRRLSSAEPADDVREAVFGDLRKDLAEFLADGKLDAAEAVVDAGAYTQSMGPAYVAAFWLVRGKPEETIARYEALAGVPEQKRAAEVLAFLYRAKGDTAAARKAAEKAHKRELIEGLLYEAADWKALAAKPTIVNAETPLEQAAFRAAYQRLAGKEKELDDCLAEVRKLAEGDPDKETGAFVAAKAFFLNDLPADGLEWVGRSNRNTARFEILVAQLKYNEAFAVVEAARTAGARDMQALELLQARTLYLLGEKEKAQAIFTRYAGDIKEGFDEEVVHALLETEYRLGLKDQAFEHCAKALALHTPDAPQKVQIRPLLAQVFPDHTDEAIVWWTVLRRKAGTEKHAQVLERLRKLLEGKTPAKELEELIADAEKGAEGLDVALVPAAQVAAARAAGREDLAERVLEKATRPEALLLLGDIQAGKRRWAQAAATYHRAWEADREQPLPMLLEGMALRRSGKEAEGKKLIDLAHTLPLGNVQLRYALIQELGKRGHEDAVRRESELMRVVASPESYHFGAAMRRLANDALAKKDYEAAARAYEQSMLRCLTRYTNFVQMAGYVGVPAMVHRVRGEARLAAGDKEGARKEIAMARTLLPGNIELSIQMLPQLEKSGLAKEGDQLFNETLAVYEKICKEYPKCAYAHNSAAWLSACCRRNLDGGLAHATKAVELAPDTPAYMDTLAEMHFQRGDKDKAVAMQKRVVELDPKKPYYRKQLARLEAGDPKADRPAEEDD